jgi:hypothetical protein
MSSILATPVLFDFSKEIFQRKGGRKERQSIQRQGYVSRHIRAGGGGLHLTSQPKFHHTNFFMHLSSLSDAQ